MQWYRRVREAINTAMPFLVCTQATNLALLVSAILKKQTLCLSELARACPIPEKRRVRDPKHCRLHRLKRLWRFTNNERVDAMEVQLALVADTVLRLGRPRWVGLAIDWTMFDTTLPSGEKMRYQVLRIAVPRKGRALPLLQLAYDRDRLPAKKSQNQLEQEALSAVVGALPEGVRPIVLADRGFHRASFIRWLQKHGLHYVVRIRKGSCLTEGDGSRWKLGEEGLKPGELRFSQGVRYGLYHGRPRDLWINVALCWRIPKSKSRDPERPSARSSRRAVVSGEQPPKREKRRRLVLAARLDRAVLQRFKGPLRPRGGQGRLSRASEPAAGGFDHGPRMAHSGGVAGDRRFAEGLPCGGLPARTGVSHKSRACSAGQTRQLTAVLSASISDRRLVGMRQRSSTA